MTERAVEAHVRDRELRTEAEIADVRELRRLDGTRRTGTGGCGSSSVLTTIFIVARA
jgi:hypothetical protein